MHAPHALVETHTASFIHARIHIDTKQGKEEAAQSSDGPRAQSAMVSIKQEAAAGQEEPAVVAAAAAGHQEQQQ